MDKFELEYEIEKLLEKHPSKKKKRDKKRKYKDKDLRKKILIGEGYKIREKILNKYREPSSNKYINHKDIYITLERKLEYSYKFETDHRWSNEELEKLQDNLDENKLFYMAYRFNKEECYIRQTKKDFDNFIIELNQFHWALYLKYSDNKKKYNQKIFLSNNAIITKLTNDTIITSNFSNFDTTFKNILYPKDIHKVYKFIELITSTKYKTFKEKQLEDTYIIKNMLTKKERDKIEKIEKIQNESNLYGKIRITNRGRSKVKNELKKLTRSASNELDNYNLSIKADPYKISKLIY